MTHDSGINASSVTGTHSQFNHVHFEDLWSSIILLLPLFTITMPNVTAGGIVSPEVIAAW